MNLSSEALIALFHKASDAKQNSYSPYSKFRVGAALLAKDGRVFTGTNVENASYGGAICAERSAVVSAVSCGCTEFDAIMITTDVDDLIAPCGFCRQFMVEFGTDLVVIKLTEHRSFYQNLVITLKR
jgi:cytidine deaminase